MKAIVFKTETVPSNNGLMNSAFRFIPAFPFPLNSENFLLAFVQTAIPNLSS
jgi:hypothetical protein